VAVAHAPAGDCHGPIAIRASHGAVGGVVSQVARGPARNLRRVGGKGRGWRVQLVGEGTVWEMLWWGQIAVVGCVGEV
tara:strand:+ start:6289 stop:6522 length:234 start_codon:yes stop_codon:yes gene_type:complete